MKITRHLMVPLIVFSLLIISVGVGTTSQTIPQSSIRITGATWQIGPPASPDAPYVPEFPSPCGILNFQGEFTVYTGPDDEFDTTDDAVFLNFYAESQASSQFYRVPINQQVTISFDQQIRTRYFFDWGLTQPVESHPLSVSLWDNSFGDRFVVFENPIAELIFDPRLYAAPCFVGLPYRPPYSVADQIPAVNAGQGNDNRLNPSPDARALVYVQADGSVQIYGVNDNSEGYLAINVSADDMNALPTHPDKNTLIAEFGEIAFYKLASGEYQVNAGPDAEGKVQVFIFDDLPPTQPVRRADFSLFSP